MHKSIQYVIWMQVFNKFYLFKIYVVMSWNINNLTSVNKKKKKKKVLIKQT